MKPMIYEDTMNEVLDQYNLTKKQREWVIKQVQDSPCSCFSKDIYRRTHAYASQAPE